MAIGYVLVESMRPGTRLDGLPLTLRMIERGPVRNPTPEQPSVWTVVEFDFPDQEAGRLADALAGVLDEHGGWYSNFSVNGETFVIYADRVFRYPSGDKTARAEAQKYGRTVVSRSISLTGTKAIAAQPRRIRADDGTGRQEAWKLGSAGVVAKEDQRDPVRLVNARMGPENR